MTTNLNIADDLELYMLDLVNAARAQEELHALVLEQHLNLAAERHTEWMIEADVFDHTGVNGSSAHQRIVDAGFDLAGSWRTGENLAVSTAYGGSYHDEVDAMFEGLMNSPGHRANILHADYQYIGIGIDTGMFVFPGQSREWFSILATQNFGTTDGAVLLDTGGEEEPVVDVAPVEEVAPVTEDLVLVGENTNDTLTGGDGNDDIRGLGGDDHLIGGAGDDIIKGGGGNDTIEGGPGNDILSGGSGDDVIMGGSGINRLVGQRGSDELHGGEQRDILNGGGGADLLYGYGGNDRVKGGGHDDIVHGGEGPDKVFGNAGADSLFGGEGDDLLNGGGDDDWLDGGTGNDRLKGGDGADVFVFGENGGTDRLLDFTVGEDVLLVHGSYWGDGESPEDLLDAHARVTSSRVIIDFGGGDEIWLDGLSSLDGLAWSIDMA